MNYAQEQRLRFIDCMLLYYGRVGPKELCDFFGVSKPTATRDFRLYESIGPGNMVFNSTAKTWAIGANYRRVYG